MSPFDVAPITAKQISEIQGLIGTKLRQSNLPSKYVQRLIDRRGGLSGSRGWRLLRDLRAAGVLAVRQDVVSVAS